MCVLYPRCLLASSSHAGVLSSDLVGTTKLLPAPISEHCLFSLLAPSFPSPLLSLNLPFLDRVQHLDSGLQKCFPEASRALEGDSCPLRSQVLGSAALLEVDGRAVAGGKLQHHRGGFKPHTWEASPTAFKSWALTPACQQDPLGRKRFLGRGPVPPSLLSITQGLLWMHFFLKLSICPSPL